MKTTLELPDALFREVKAAAARRGILMKQLIAEALEEKLAAPQAASDPKPWMKLAGCAAGDPEMMNELKRPDKVVENEFGQILARTDFNPLKPRR